MLNLTYVIKIVVLFDSMTARLFTHIFHHMKNTACRNTNTIEEIKILFVLTITKVFENSRKYLKVLSIENFNIHMVDIIWNILKFR